MAGSTARCNPSRSAAETPFRAIALGTSLPRILSGKASAVAVSNVNGFGIAGGNPAAAPLRQYLRGHVRAVRGQRASRHGHRDLRGSQDVEVRRSPEVHACSGRQLSRGRFGDALRQTAQLIKSNLGVQIAFTDIGGWDNHVNEGAVEGQLANVLRDFAQSIAAFWTDLGSAGGRDGDRHHVGVRTHRARKRQSRH